jgi:hypothetical protein
MCICRVHVQALTRFLFRGSVLALFTLRSMSYGEYVGQQSHEQTPPRAPAATAPPPSEPGYATAPGHRPTPAPSPSTPPMWASGQTVEEEGGEDAAAMTEGMATGPEEEDRMVYVRRNRELLDNLDGWSIDALVRLYYFLREQRVRPSPPPSYKEPPLSRQAPPPPIPKPKYMPTLPKSGQIRRCLDRYRCPEPTATPTQMPEPEPNEAQPQEPHGPASSSVLDSPNVLESLDSPNVFESVMSDPRFDWCPSCSRYDRCPCDEEEVDIARDIRRMHFRETMASLRFEIQQNPE